MFDALNFTISIIALIVAIATAIAAHRYYVINEQGRRRELLLGALQAADEACFVFQQVERERLKTGPELDVEEASLFQQFSEMESMLSKTSEVVNSVLSIEEHKIPNDMVLVALQMKKASANLNRMGTMLHARFVNCNNNKIDEISTRLKLVRDLARQLSTRQGTN
jgi:hypothetical protein